MVYATSGTVTVQSQDELGGPWSQVGFAMDRGEGSLTMHIIGTNVILILENMLLSVGTG